VYICFGIFFIAGLSKGSLILRYLWKTKFRGKLSRTVNHFHKYFLLNQFLAVSRNGWMAYAMGKHSESACTESDIFNVARSVCAWYGSAAFAAILEFAVRGRRFASASAFLGKLLSRSS
jgi:hypothetical protein